MTNQAASRRHRPARQHGRQKEFNMFQRPSEPQSIGKVIDTAFKLFRASLRQVFAAVAR